MVCSLCGAEFDEPRVIRRRENLDAEYGVEVRIELVCPGCGADETYFEEEYDGNSEDTDAQYEPRGVAC